MELTVEQENLVAQELSPIDEEQEYDAWLDDVFGEVNIAGNSYDTSTALKELDPTAYRCGKADWLDSENSDNRIVEVKGDWYLADEVETLLENQEEGS